MSTLGLHSCFKNKKKLQVGIYFFSKKTCYPLTVYIMALLVVNTNEMAIINAISTPGATCKVYRNLL